MLRVSLLGQVRFTLDDEPLTGFISSKVQALLCYLILNPQHHSRDALIGLFWGNAAEADARANLRVALSNLRKLLGDYLDSTRQTAAFNRASPYELDVDILGRYVERGELKEAAELYRGEFMQGFYLTDSPLFEEWQASERERLRRTALHVFQALATKLAQEHAYREAIGCSLKLVDLEPWRETSHRQLMLFYARTGQFASALKQFKQCKQLLNEELGVEPTSETVQLYERIARAREAPRPNLPASPTPFVGRVQELTTIGQHLTDPDYRLLSLVGTGGVGKTRLALAVAQHFRHHFLEGCYFIALGSVETHPAFLLSLAAALGLGFSDDRDLDAQIIRHIDDREILLVLDNYEQLIEQSTDFIIWLLKETTRLKLLVTSRERLNLNSEWTLVLEGLSYPEFAKDFRGAFEHYDAARLFIQTAKRVNASFQLTTADEAHIAKVCYLLQGLPLALELAAIWVHHYSLLDIAAKLQEGLDLLATSAKDVECKHRSIRAALDYSWDRLSWEEQRSFTALAVFRGSFGHQAAQALFNLSERDLGSLVDKSLLRTLEGKRYDFHPLILDYAAEKLAEDTRTKFDLQTAHARYFSDLAAQAANELKGSQQASWLDRLEKDHDNLRASLAFAESHGQSQLGLSLADSLFEFWKIRSYLSEGRSWQQRVSAIVPKGELESGLARVLNQAGSLAWMQGEYDAAKHLHEKSLAIYQNLQDEVGTANVLTNLGQLAYQEGDYDAARRYYKTSLAAFRRLHKPSGISTVLNNLALLHKQESDFATAQKLLEECLALDRERGDQRSIALSLNNLGFLALNQDNYDEAYAFMQESLAIRQSIQDKWGVASTLNNMGNVALAWKDYELATQNYKESLELAHEIGHKRCLIWNLEAFGATLSYQGYLEQAVHLWSFAGKLREDIRYRQPPHVQARYSKDLSAVKSKISAQAFDKVWFAARLRSIQGVVDFALSQPKASQAQG